MAALLVRDGRNPQIESFRPQLDLRRVGQVFRISDDTSLVLRILMENVEGFSKNLLGRNWKQMPHGAKRSKAGLIDLGDVEIGVAHHDVDRHVVEHLQQAPVSVSSFTFSVASSHVSIGPV